MPDTLLVLATIGRTFPLAQAALLAAEREAAMPYDLFVALDEATDTHAAWLTDQGATVNRCAHRRGLVGAYNAGFREFLAGEWTWLALLEDGVRVPHHWDEFLRLVLASDPQIGWAACTQVENRHARFTAFASLMSRPCAEALGGLDELFAPEQFDDGDALMRARQAGFRPVGTTCQVWHPRSRTSVAHSPAVEAERLETHRRLFEQRWGLPDVPWDTVPVVAKPVPVMRV